MCKHLKKIAVLISGSGTNLQSLIDAVERGEIKGEISLIISNNKDAYGLTRGENHNIKSVYISHKSVAKDEYELSLLQLLKEERIDLIVLAGYLKILGENIINKYENKIINIHPSLIPTFCGKGYYGLKVHEEVIKYGAKVSGATTHFVNKDPDGGPIILQRTVEVKENDRPQDLQERVLEVEHRILVESVKAFCEDKIQVFGRQVKGLE